MKKQTAANLLLLLTAVIWGGGFVAQVTSSDSLTPMAFNSLRMLLGSVTLLPVILLTDKAKKQKGEPVKGFPIGSGILCGIMLTLGSSLQELGIYAGASSGKAGFLTALYIILVPLLGLFARKRPPKAVWPAVVLSVAGLYLLCITDKLILTQSDIYLLLCALAFSFHILVVDDRSRETDNLKLACVQFFTTAVLCGIAALLTEHFTLTDITNTVIPILYAGIFSAAIGYTLQIVGQKDTDPTVASLIMCLESVFAVIWGWLLLGDQMTLREYAGCALMLCAILLAQLPDKKKAS